MPVNGFGGDISQLHHPVLCASPLAQHTTFSLKPRILRSVPIMADSVSDADKVCTCAGSVGFTILNTVRYGTSALRSLEGRMLRQQKAAKVQHRCRQLRLTRNLLPKRRMDRKKRRSRTRPPPYRFRIRLRNWGSRSRMGKLPRSTSHQHLGDLHRSSVIALPPQAEADRILQKFHRNNGRTGC